MARASVDNTRLMAKIKATQAVARLAAHEGGRALGGAFVAAVEPLSPRDTNRYVRAWIDAGNRAGVTSMPLPPVVASRNQDRYIEKLRAQVEFWAGRVRYARGRMAQYEQWDAAAPPRRDGSPRAKRVAQPYYKKMKRLEQTSLRRLQRAGEELAKAQQGGDGFLFFDAEGVVQRRQGRKLSTVREKVYGGTGRVWQAGTRIVVELRNREPHGVIIERHPHLGHPVATAKEIVRTAGLAPVSRAYKKELIARSPLGNRAAIAA